MATPLEILRVRGGNVKQHSYVVKLKAGTDKQAHINHINTHVAALDGHSDVTHGDWRSDFFHGYAGKFSGASLDAVRSHSDVEYIEEDGIVEAHYTCTQTNAPWGLARISTNYSMSGQDPNYCGFSYSYDSSAGSGVDIYVLDTGVYCEHADFGGRAKWGANYVYGTSNIDYVGHGTHCAGTAGGTTYGVAKAATIIAVKVLGDYGTGNTSDIISGMDWVIYTAYYSGRPSVMSMSLGGGWSQAINDTAYSATTYNVHVVVAAGNSNIDANYVSPASASNVITVGASNISDYRWNMSNWGSCLTLFAPGENVISCGTSGPYSTSVKSGTSMATPHVAGMVACLISKEGNISPWNMLTKVYNMSLKNVLYYIPSGTANALLRNDQ